MLTRRRLLTCATVTVAGGLLEAMPIHGAGPAGQGAAEQPTKEGGVTVFRLPELPFARNALAPHISAETIDYHYGKHHAAYVDKLNELVRGSPWAEKPLETIIREVGPGPIFNNAAQHWNHSFYWQCLSPTGGGEPTGMVADEIIQAYGDFKGFRQAFGEAALTLFGSGWAWLVRRADGRLAIVQTPNAENPLLRNETPLLTCDVWEHAYYIDYRNARARYVDAFWNLVNWKAIAARL